MTDDLSIPSRWKLIGTSPNVRQQDTSSSRNKGEVERKREREKVGYTG
jgi:hypothetical protein